MQDKLSLIIFVMRDNPLLDKLSGSGSWEEIMNNLEKRNSRYPSTKMNIPTVRVRNFPSRKSYA